MHSKDLKKVLNTIITNNIQNALMLWGAPGIGKSSIVQQVARQNNLEFVDLRLSQLAPTDLRGLPVPEAGVSKWFPPEFLPTAGKGILFLDEMNMAPPAMQGMAQQLILDRRVGSYVVPEGWFIWAAGNRKEDRASVFDMPAPLGNRFMHFSLEADLDAFKSYAFIQKISERIIAFLDFRPELLHKLETHHQPAWPSPRSWVMASNLLAAGLEIAPAIGEGAASEFKAFCRLYEHLPSLEPILAGKGQSIVFPDAIDVRYAIVSGLISRAQDEKQALAALHWSVAKAPPEWTQRLVFGVLEKIEAIGGMKKVAALVSKMNTHKDLVQFMGEYVELIRG